MGFLFWEHLLCRDIRGGSKEVGSLGAAALPGTTYMWPECLNCPIGDTADALGFLPTWGKLYPTLGFLTFTFYNCHDP